MAFRDVVEAERKAVFPNLTLLNSVKHYGLPTGWPCRGPSTLKPHGTCEPALLGIPLVDRKLPGDRELSCG